MQQLHDEHAAALWGYCVRLTGHDRARAEDVVQETLLRA
ncbi:MAG: sigma factor, partial [Aeromicrobium sp.]